MARVSDINVDAGAFSFRTTGFAALQTKLEHAAGEELDIEMEMAVEEVLEEVLAQSQAIVPYDTGRLHDSAFLRVERTSRGIKTEIGYDTEYAVFVHENPDAYHEPPTQWQFLLEPLMRAQPRLEQRVQAGVRRLLLGS